MKTLLRCARYLRAIGERLPDSAESIVEQAGNLANSAIANCANIANAKSQLDDCPLEMELRNIAQLQHPQLLKLPDSMVAEIIAHNCEEIRETRYRALDAIARGHWLYVTYSKANMDLVPLAIEMLSDGWLSGLIADLLDKGMDPREIQANLTDPTQTVEAQMAIDAGIYRGWKAHVAEAIARVQAELAPEQR